MTQSSVLIVEDDRAVADVVRYNLKQAGYDVSVAYDGHTGLQQAISHRPDLVILDLMLPIIEGSEVCRRLRSEAATRDTLILMLTAKSEETDQVGGFTMGADDYVTKPFSVKVLLERIKALERRRNQATTGQEVLSSQGITIDRRRHLAAIDDQPLSLTLSEFRLLEALIRHPGRAFSRPELIDAALGEDTMVLERTIDVHIRSLRQKMQSRAELVETVRGVGYRFRDPAGPA